MICCFFSSFKTFAMLREATYPPAAVNVLDVSSESMAAFQVFLYGRFWVFTEVEAAYLSGSSWTSYPPVTVTGNSNSFYTFNCFAAHQGQSDIRGDSLRSTGFPHA